MNMIFSLLEVTYSQCLGNLEAVLTFHHLMYLQR